MYFSTYGSGQASVDQALTELDEGLLDWIATDGPLDEEYLAPNGRLQVPFFASAILLVYNISSIPSTTPLVFIFPSLSLVRNQVLNKRGVYLSGAGWCDIRSDMERQHHLVERSCHLFSQPQPHLAFGIDRASFLSQFCTHCLKTEVLHSESHTLTCWLVRWTSRNCSLKDSQP